MLAITFDAKKLGVETSTFLLFIVSAIRTFFFRLIGHELSHVEFCPKLLRSTVDVPLPVKLHFDIFRWAVFDSPASKKRRGEEGG